MCIYLLKKKSLTVRVPRVKEVDLNSFKNTQLAKNGEELSELLIFILFSTVIHLENEDRWQSPVWVGNKTLRDACMQIVDQLATMKCFKQPKNVEDNRGDEAGPMGVAWESDKVENSVTYKEQ